mmetsp:Transcript_9344/g.16892  ORF Transcript_9344/g.16892 Transcript_9344/m.16892 type:complete len:221 (-) Transcript_9344:96-758(-)|eukprot:CAMPEP_0201636042 /NCGR_PEP_ID=MMETSP0493-20130528/8352_1 /ASSEMBLY_ACC=CAM_ASM_000838 /TAXON_ID=420259 /ORGANISM="Thalassiosira gravida, Strain GMp14c1" /LENGTH=220 /DNA_ID=CAMNT_0048108075 /DNA_START=91 /DNA_END=753 /DNA_ORIENTATION=+
MNLLSLCIIALSTISVEGLSLRTNSHQAANQPSTRRSVLQQASFGIVAAAPFIQSINVANAVDAQFAEVGQQERAPNGESPFSTLANGVQIKDFREGGSGATVGTGTKVELTMKGRLINLNGIIFYDTKSNDPNGFGEGTPLIFTVGDGTVLPGLDSGVVGMTKGGIRRIIVPADVGYGKYPALEPQPLTTVEKRALDSVVKNPRRDQTVMFDVKVERVR